MNAPFPVALNDLLTVAHCIAHVHGIPPQAVLLHTLAMASALAGDLVTSHPEGGALVPAKFSILIRTTDLNLPLWIDQEWQHLLERQSQVINAPPNPKYAAATVAALRRRQRILTALNNGSTFEASMIDSHLQSSKNKKTFRFLHVVGNGPCPPIGKGGRSITLAAPGIRALSKVLRSQGDPAGYVAMLDLGPADRSNLMAWVGSHDFKKLVQEAGRELPKLGVIIECPARSFLPDDTMVAKVAAAAMVQRLEAARFGSIRYQFRPTDEARCLLGRQAGQTRALLDQVPATTRTQALPDPHLAWHLSALLAALCSGSGPEGQQTLHATSLGTALASWAIEQHIHHVRHAFPGDHLGPFEGQDLRVLRFLGDQPSTVRDIQRRFREVNKASCLMSLRRAVAAGLALEPQPERFAAVPVPGHELSDFDPSPDPETACQSASDPQFTDNTDSQIP